MRTRNLSLLLVVVFLSSAFVQAADQATPVGETKFQTTASAQAATPLDTKVTDAKLASSPTPSKKDDNRDVAHGVWWLLKKIGQGAKAYVDSFKTERKKKVFHCKIPNDYSTRTPETLEMRSDVQEFVPPPPVESMVEKPAADLCLTDSKKFYEEQAGWLYSQSVLKPQLNAEGILPEKSLALHVIGSPDVSLSGTPDSLRLLQRLIGSGEKAGKHPASAGPASWPDAANACPAGDSLCTLTKLFDQGGQCDGDRNKPCAGRESAYLAYNMGKTAQYFPSLSQWYPAQGPDGQDWAQKWETETLRSMSHVLAMLPRSAARFPVDKDFRMFPPNTVIGNCPNPAPAPDAGGPRHVGTGDQVGDLGSSTGAQTAGACKAGEAWPASDEATAGKSQTIGMAQVEYYDPMGSGPAAYSDSYILVTDKLVNSNRMLTCKGLVHELTHHFDYSFMFDTNDLPRQNRGPRQVTMADLLKNWGVSGFGKYSSLPVTDATATSAPATSFDSVSWSCQRPGEGCSHANGIDTGFVTDYAGSAPMEDFAESVSHYVCDPIELLLRAPKKYAWLKTHLFTDRTSGQAREFWVPDHEKWPGFDQALKNASQGNAGADGLLLSCLSSFTQFQVQGFKWTSGQNAGTSFSKIAAFFPDPDPTRAQRGLLKGYFVQDVLSEFNCVGGLAKQIDSDIRAGMTDQKHPRPDNMYCSIGSTDAVKYLAAKRAGYVATPFFQALANVGLNDKDGTKFQSLSGCKAEDRNSCPFLAAYYKELDSFGEAFSSAGLTDQGRTRGVDAVLALIRNN